MPDNVDDLRLMLEHLDMPVATKFIRTVRGVTEHAQIRQDEVVPSSSTPPQSYGLMFLNYSPVNLNSAVRRKSVVCDACRRRRVAVSVLLTMSEAIVLIRCSATRKRSSFVMSVAQEIPNAW